MSSSYIVEAEDNDRHACIIQDSTLCCAQELEYELSGKVSYPEDEEQIEISGTLDVYDEDGEEFAVIKNASLI